MLTYEASGYVGGFASPRACAIRDKLSCSQHIRIFLVALLASNLETNLATQAASSRSQDVSTVRPRSVATGWTVSKGRVRFPPKYEIIQVSQGNNSQAQTRETGTTLTSFWLLGNNISNVILRGSSEDGSQTLGSLLTLCCKALAPICGFLSVADKIHGLCCWSSSGQEGKNSEGIGKSHFVQSNIRY
jgi:hypothetical protein